MRHPPRPCQQNNVHSTRKRVWDTSFNAVRATRLTASALSREKTGYGTLLEIPVAEYLHLTATAGNVGPHLKTRNAQVGERDRESSSAKRCVNLNRAGRNPCFRQMLIFSG